MRFSLIILLFGSSFIGNAQSFEVFGADFNTTLNSSNSLGLSQANIKVNFPLKLKNGLLTQGIYYSKNSINYNSEYAFGTSNIEDFTTIKYSLGFLKNIKNDWKLKLQIAPTISSNFDSGLSFDDVFFNGSLVFIKTNKASKLRLGLVYNTAFGMKTPIPVISYSNQITNRFSYTIGMPVTKLEYKLSKHDKVDMYIKPKGFYANLTNSISLGEALIKAEKARYKTVVSGLNYLHKIDNYWKISVDLGYQLYAAYDLLNNNNSVYEFDIENNFFIGVNIKYNLKNKKN